MSAQSLEAFLARIYVDAEARSRFLSDPMGEAARAGLSHQECTAVQSIDRVGLELASRSFQRKRMLRKTAKFRIFRFLSKW
jgi:hypothetical protein